MRFEQLRYLDTALRFGSLRRAAAELGIAQPSLSAQIQRLEEDLGVVLMVRGTQGIRATAAAEAMLPQVRAALRAEDAIRQEASAISGLRYGRVRLGSISAASHSVLPETVRRFQSEHPNIHFQVTEKGSAVIREQVAAGEFDMGIVSRFAEDTAHESGLRYIDLAGGRIALCVPPEHPLTLRQAVRADDLEGQEMVVFHTGYLLRVAFDVLAANRDIQAIYYTDSAETAQHMVAAGVGLCLASTLAPATMASNRVRLVRLDESWAETRMSVVLRADEQPSPAVRTFLRILREETQGMAEHFERPVVTASSTQQQWESHGDGYE